MSEAAPTPEVVPHPLPFSVLILTLDEEINLPGCLASLRGCDDIVVLDSGSTDRTVEFARQAGARVFERAFDSFAQQRNFAQREIPFRHPWVLHLDADERLSVPLRLECSGVAGCREVDGFLAASKICWDGKWVRRSSRFPEWQVRFVRAPEFQFVDGPGRARAAPAMRMGRLNTSCRHDASLRTEGELLRRHRRYAQNLARFHRTFVHAPALTFGYRYLFRGGFLDGAAGYSYCRQLMRYERLIADELRQQAKGSPSRAEGNQQNKVR